MSEPEENIVPLKIVKPSFLEPFKSKRAPTIAGVETLLTGVAGHEDRRCQRFRPSASARRRLLVRPNCASCSVPIHGDKRDQLHLIDEDIAMMHLSAKKVKRFRLALATKPYDAVFFCMVPTTNVDNSVERHGAEGDRQGATRTGSRSSSRKERRCRGLQDRPGEGCRCVSGSEVDNANLGGVDQGHVQRRDDRDRRSSGAAPPDRGTAGPVVTGGPRLDCFRSDRRPRF